MQLEITEQELGVIFQALTELPFKVAAPILQNIETQFKAYKEIQQIKQDDFIIS